MILGLTGGILGLVLLLPLSLLFAGYYGIGDMTALMLLLTLIAGVCGIVGGALAKTHLNAPRLLLVLGAVLGFVGLRYFWVVPGILLFLATGFQLGVKDEVGNHPGG